MKKILLNFMHLFIGVVIIPAFMILMFSGLNYLLAIVFNIAYYDIQRSVTWVLYGIIIAMFSFTYLSDVANHIDKK